MNFLDSLYPKSKYIAPIIDSKILPKTLSETDLSLCFISDVGIMFLPILFRFFLPIIKALFFEKYPSSSFECFRNRCSLTTVFKIASPKNSSFS